jgi:hypothetical protein
MYFRSKKREYLKDCINKLAKKNENIRDLHIRKMNLGWVSKETLYQLFICQFLLLSLEHRAFVKCFYQILSTAFFSSSLHVFPTYSLTILLQAFLGWLHVWAVWGIQLFIHLKKV